MQKLYSKTTGSCYLVGIHSDIPADAKEISDELFVEVIGNPDPAKVRSHDATGRPILIDPPAATPAQLASAERLWRDAELEAWQWLRDRHRDEQDLQRDTTLTAAQFNQVLAYLQALRDWPQAESFPDEAQRPSAPTLQVASTS